MNKRQPLVIIVIPVHNNWSFTKRCLSSLAKINYQGHKVMVVDDGSTDQTYNNIVKGYKWVNVVSGNGSLWWSGAMNLGVRTALKKWPAADYILSLNNDLVVDRKFLTVLVSFLRVHPHSIAGSKILYYGKKVIWQYGSGIIKQNMRLVGLNKNTDDSKAFNGAKEVIGLTGMSVLIPCDVFRVDNVWYDSKNFPMYLGDNDFIFRARGCGYKVYVVGKSKVSGFIEHTASKSYGGLNLLGFIRFVFSPKSALNPWLDAKFYFRHFGLHVALVRFMAKTVQLVQIMRAREK